MPATNPIKHVVVLMLENRSFDQMLGCMPGVDGVSDENVNYDASGKPYRQLPGAQDVLRLDPTHGLRSVLAQMNAGEPLADPEMPLDFMKWLKTVHHTMASLIPLMEEGWEKLKDRFFIMGAPMTGFVKQFAADYPDSTHDERQQIMSYFARGELPALHCLAEHFTICEQWYSSVPGPTWSNRLFLHSGTSAGTTWMPHGKSQVGLPYMFNQRTIYDELSAKGISWRVYFHDFPQVLALANMRKPDARPNIVAIDEWENDLRKLGASFPSFSFIEPAYFDFNVPGNDDHPPHNAQEAQKLIARIYNSLRNSSIWERSLLVITYDEHGGFYDHVNPPTVIAPDNLQTEYSFNQLGVRVPALLVSPYAQKAIYRGVLDHTSVGAYLVERFGIAPLGARMANAQSLSDALTLERDNIGPESIPGANVFGALSMTKPLVAEERNENQIALDELSKALVADMPPETVFAQGDGATAQAMSMVEDNPRTRALQFLRGSA